jgi:hypothetical protein
LIVAKRRALSTKTMGSVCRLASDIDVLSSENDLTIVGNKKGSLSRN